MDVRLPDGTLLRNVPDGTTKAQLFAKLKANGYDVSKLGAPPSDTGDVGGAPEIPGYEGPPAPPAVASSPWKLPTAREFIVPTVEGLGFAGGAALGGLLGGPVAPLTATAGAGLGYGVAKQGIRLVDEALGNAPKPTNALEPIGRSAQDVLFGMTADVGGKVLFGQVIPQALKGAGWAWDWLVGKVGPVKAGQILRDAAGQDFSIIKNQLKTAPQEYTAGQATSGTNNPTWQALNERIKARDPRFYGGDHPLTPSQQAEGVKALTPQALSENATAALHAQNEAKKALRKRLIPTWETEMEAANTANVLKPRYDAKAQAFEGAAENKVQDVRRFTAAGERAAERAHTTTGQAAMTAVPGYPRQPGRYTYMGDLIKKAEEVAAKSADDSLPMGEAARFNKMVADSFEAYGLRPLKPDSIMAGIEEIAKNPDYAGKTDLVRALRVVGNTINKWLTPEGYVNARALDSIRKDQVNSIAERLSRSADPTAAAKLTAKITAELKPMIEQAIEKAGGTGYGQYLKDYSAGLHAVDQAKLSKQALDLFKTNPAEFVKLVEGNSPDTVRKVFGYGNYDIAKEMSREAMESMKGVSDITKAGLETQRQASLGMETLVMLLKEHMPSFRLPPLLMRETMATNAALKRAEEHIGKRTMNILTVALKTGKSASEAMEILPAAERTRVLRAIKEASMFASRQAPGAIVNPLATEQ